MSVKDLATVVKTKIAGFKFVIKAKYVKAVCGFPFDKNDTLWHNVFRISFKKDSGKTVSVLWYDSYNNYKDGVTHLNEKEAVEAFISFLQDGWTYLSCRSFEEFCNEFGYDTDSRQAEKTYKACGKIYDKLQAAGFDSSDDLCNVINEAENLVSK